MTSKIRPLLLLLVLRSHFGIFNYMATLDKPCPFIGILGDFIEAVKWPLMLQNYLGWLLTV